MNRREFLIFVTALALMGATAVVLARFKTVQRLGQPGVRTHALPGSRNLVVDFPEKVLNFDSKLMEMSPLVTGALPKDTSYGQRLYQSPDGFEAMMTAVLMGSDRTSIHKPQFCLEGQGWHIEPAASAAAWVKIRQPQAYDLPVMKLVATKPVMIEGRVVTLRGLYVYWFVAQDRVTAEHWRRMWWMAEELLRTRVLERWAYVSCFAVCEPGREDATFERMKDLIAAAVPQFQLATGKSPATEGGK